MKTVECKIFLQARCSSIRFPFKVLRKLKGYEIFILAALRAGNTGLPVSVLTSTEESDNEICNISKNYGVDIFRGPLNDVLGRFHFATWGMSESTIICRLTADNVIPDGDLIMKCLDKFICTDHVYLSTCRRGSTLPEGVCVELFRKSSLTQAFNQTVDEYDREHVTPYIIRQEGPKIENFDGGLSGDYSHLRFTIDFESDLRKLETLFNGVSDPIGMGWKDLVGAGLDVF